MAPVIITASRVADDPFELARSVIVVNQEDLIRRNQASVLDSLNRSIGIWVEKRTATTSDPVMRGLAGANILALVDGNNLSTFWGEGGDGSDDLYGKVEAESLQRIEVVRGPASVQYGSNALGGVINFITRQPMLEAPSSGIVLGGRTKGAYGSVNKLGMLRLDQEFAIPDLRLRLGGTWRDMGDGQGGAGVGTLDPSRGREQNFDFNGDYRLNDKHRILFSGQRVERRGIKRFYRPTQNNENDRTGLAVSHLYEEGEETSLETKLYYQWKEDRRDFGNGDHGRAWWYSSSIDLIGKTQWCQEHRLVTGLSLRRDEGQSPGDEEFSVVDGMTGLRRKDAPNQQVYEGGIFVQDDWQLSSCLKLTGAVRYGYFDYQSNPDMDYVPAGVGTRDDDRYREKEAAWTGGLGMVYRIGEDWRAGASWNRGFRFLPPMFGIVQVGSGYRVPSGLEDPITADQFELALRHRSAAIESNLVGYYTDFDGFQSDEPTTFNGSSFFDANGNSMQDPGEQFLRKAANSDAVVFGVEWDVRMDVHQFVDAVPEGYYLGGGFMWNYGKNLSDDEPLRRTHPARGLLILGYEEPETKRFYCEFIADMVAAYTRVPSDRAGDPTYFRDPQDPGSGFLRENNGVVGALPGYTVYDLRMGLRFNDQVRCGINIENLSNKNYRPAHNRMDAFGFNLGVFLEATF